MAIDETPIPTAAEMRAARDATPMRLRLGRITATFTVWCGVAGCGASFTAPQHHSKGKATSAWMSLGWCRFAGVWKCPQCAAKHQWHTNLQDP